MSGPSTLTEILKPGVHSARPAANAVATGAVYACSTHHLQYQSDGATWSTFFDPGGVAGATFPLEAIIDAGGTVLTAGTKAYIYVPAACTITGVVLLGDQSGSIAIEVQRCTYTAFDPTTHPATGDKISASAPPTITTAKKSKDTTLTGWTTSLAADDVLALVVTGSPTSITRVTVAFTVTR